ncbi:MAG: hypothetical protein QM772_00255 [Ottowia sp.]|uniref:hypothetical protein n=1 Tax=Ottowia sp. TaxID=1898956 RepID=UPI0039E35ABE
MDTYDIYGSNLDLKQIKIKIEDCLNIDFILKDSSYFGEYFQWRSSDDEGIEIKKNIDLTDGEPLKPQFSNYSALVFIDRTKRSDQIYKLLNDNGFERLSHNTYMTK